MPSLSGYFNEETVKGELTELLLIGVIQACLIAIGYPIYEYGKAHNSSSDKVIGDVLMQNTPVNITLMITQVAISSLIFWVLSHIVKHQYCTRFYKEDKDSITILQRTKIDLEKLIEYLEAKKQSLTNPQNGLADQAEIHKINTALNEADTYLQDIVETLKDAEQRKQQSQQPNVLNHATPPPLLASTVSRPVLSTTRAPVLDLDYVSLQPLLNPTAPPPPLYGSAGSTSLQSQFTNPAQVQTNKSRGVTSTLKSSLLTLFRINHKPPDTQTYPDKNKRDSNTNTLSFV